MIADRLAAVLAVRQNEIRLSGRIVVLFAVTQMSHGLGANAADALFLVRFGVDNLPLMIFLSGPAVMIATLVHGAGLAHRGPRRWLWQATLASASLTLLGWASIGLGQDWVYGFIWISTQAIIWVTFTMMWNSAEAACDTRQAKRLFPLFAAGGIVGGVVGNLLTGPLASLLGAEHLLVVQAFLLFGSTALLRRFGGLFIEDQAQETSSIWRDLIAAGSMVRSGQLLRLAALASLFMSILFYLVVFPFNEAVVASFGSEAEIAGFLGLFSSMAATVTFLVSLLLTKTLFVKWGVVTALMLVPLVYLAGFSVWLVSFGLVTAAITRGMQWIAVNAIGITAHTALFNVVTGRRRGQLMAFMTAVPAQIGTMLAGAILLTGAGLPATVRYAGGLLIALTTAAIVIAMRPAYRTAIVSAVRQGLIGVFSVPQRGLVTPVDAETRRLLISHLDDARPDTRAMAVSSLARVEDRASVSHIEPFMEDDSPLVRVAAFDSVCTVNPERILERAQAAITDPAPEVRLRVLQVVAALEADQHRPLAATALEDPDPRVAAAAAAIVGGDVGRQRVEELLASQDLAAICAVLEEMVRSGGAVKTDPTRYLVDPHPHVRAAAAAAYRYWSSGDPGTLLRGLDDPSLRVRRASAESLARLPGGVNLLNEVLESGSVAATDEALRVVTPVDTLEPRFTAWAGRVANRVIKLRALEAALGGSVSTAGFLAQVLAGRAARLEQWVLRAISTTRTREVMPILERGLRSLDAETKAQAIEALEMAGDRRALGILLPLLESKPLGSTRDRRSALRELLDDFDPWLRALATRSLADDIASDLDRLRSSTAADRSDIVRSALPTLPDMTTERFDILSPLDRVLALHRIPMFSELDPEDLDLIARATDEVHYQANEPIYREGDEASEMLVIVHGSAVASRLRSSVREVLRIHQSGQYVGELGLLGGGSRSADVHAGNDGLHGLVVTKVDLLSILEERPTVALGMLATLAKRLAEPS